MAESLHIHQFKTRYRLSSRTHASRDRLDSVLREVMDEALDVAMAELGVSVNEELCIRELHSLVRLRLQDSDRQLAEQWSHALAAAIQEAMAREGSNHVVRYRSRLHGLTDFATGVAYDRLQRAWAWRQLGFVDDETDLSLSRAVEQLTNTLAAEPQLILPLFRTLAGEGRLPALVERLDAACWPRLSQSVAGMLIPELVSSVAQEQNVSEAAMKPDSSAMRQAQRQLSQSRIAQTLLSHPQSFVRSQTPLASLVVLIVAEVDSALFMRPQTWLTQWLEMLAKVLLNTQPALAPLARGWLVDAQPIERNVSSEEEQSDPLPEAIAVSTEKALPEGAEKALQETGEAEESEVHSQLKELSERDESFATATDDELSLADTTATRTAVKERQPHVTDPLLNEVSPWSEPEFLTTDWGGLFFLYGVMDELSLPQQLMNDPQLLQRPFAWLLYHFAIELLPMVTEDAASLVFAGAVPGEPLPWEDEPSIAESECQALATHVTTLCDLLVQRLAWQGGVAAMLDWLCRRFAHLRSEPGWLTVVLPLDAIDTDVRRAMLDINPGYLPWLGRVVEIAYE